jgi:hypothetical protein
MRRRIVTGILVGVALSATVAGGGQSARLGPVPRMPDGHPDLQGVWANNGMTPLERPKQFGLRATMTTPSSDLKKKAQALQDGGDAFFADELFTAAIEGKTKFSSADTQTGNYDQTWLSDRDLGQPHVAHHRSARRPHSAAGGRRRRARARRRGGRPQGAGAGRQRRGSSLGTRCSQLRHAEHPSPAIRATSRSHRGPGWWRCAAR